MIVNSLAGNQRHRGVAIFIDVNALTGNRVSTIPVFLLIDPEGNLRIFSVRKLTSIETDMRANVDFP